MEARIGEIQVSAYTVPTDHLESDGTLEWNSTTLILVEICAAQSRGLGFTYSSRSAAELIREKLADAVRDSDAMDVPANWNRMIHSVRNFGQEGIAAAAISAVDVALWDLKAKLLEVPLMKLLGAVRDSVPAYGSGGFTSYSKAQLQRQLGDWIDGGLRSVKMKVGREPQKDPARVAAARKAIGPKAELFVDANGACTPKQALQQAARFREFGVTWFEEPVVAWNFAGTRFVREHAPAEIEIAGGEYGSRLGYFRDLLAGEVVDVLQADATRCAGITGFMQVGALCEAYDVPLSSHTAPSIHTHPCCALNAVRHVEYFHDHTRIEQMFFEGAARQVDGQLRPDLTSPGLGLEFKRSDAAKYSVQP